MKEERIYKDVHEYVEKVCKDNVELFAFAFRGKILRDKMNRKNGTTFAVISRKSLLEMSGENLEKLFAVHQGETKTADKMVQSIVDSFNGLRNCPFEIVFVEGLEYKEIPKDVHGTRATFTEKMVCNALGFRWCGALKGSGAFEHETGEMLIKGRAVPDGWKHLEGRTIDLEVKCVRGRFHGKPE